MRRTIQIFTTLALFAALSCLAQDEVPTAVMPQNRAGDLPFSSLVGTGIEHVEATTGNLVIDIPILDLPGRGMNYSFHLKWDARFWVAATRGGSQPFEMWNIEERGYLPQFNNGLWSTNMPRISYVSYTKICNTNDPDALNHVYPGNVHGTGSYIYHDASGAKHPVMVGYETAECEIGSYTINNSRGPALSGSGLIVTLDPLGGGGINSTYFSDGTKGTIGGFASDVFISSSQSETHVGVPTYQDVYGNTKSEIPGGADTLGRTMLSRTDTTNQTVFTVLDSSGIARTYTVNYVDCAISTNFNMASIYGGLVREYVGTRKAISSIVLPNGRSYSFQYDNYGYVSRITFPTGAIIDYTWANDGPPERVRYVASRTVTVNGQSNRWDFLRSNGAPDDCAPGTVFCKKITVTGPAPEHNQTVYGRSDSGGGPNISRVRIYQGAAAGAPLREYTITYLLDVNEGSSVSLPTSLITKLKNGLVSEKDFTYDMASFDYMQCDAGEPHFCTQDNSLIHNVGVSTSRGNVVTIKEYDWGQNGPGALIRTTTNDYLHDSNGSYVGPNVVDKILRQTITDTSGTVAKTEYEYDNLTTTGPYLGSVTKVKRWRNTDNAMIPTAYAYNSFGNIASITDPNQHITTWDYTDRWANAACAPSSNSNAYVTQVKNHLNQRIQLTRYPCTGQIQARKNENDILAGGPGTTFTYDLLNRPASTNFPDAGRIDICNSDIPSSSCFDPAASVKTIATKKINSSLNLVTTVVTDGLGRTQQTQLNSDPLGVDYVDTTYDSLGRTSTVTNPYRTTSDTTYGLTTSQYDALGRATQITKQDGSISRVAYNVLTSVAVNGDCTVTTDEAGKQRGACSDALGRLVEVDEPSGATVQANYHGLMQADGNFALLNSAGTSVWATGTAATNAASIFMQDDGNLVTYIFKWQAGVYAAPTPGSYPNSACSIGTYLVAGQMLPPGKCIVSPHGQYFLLMNTDGNFFIYDWAHSTGTWGPGTQGHPGAYAIFQTDGNLVVYDVNGTALWNSGTSGTYAERLDMNDDGRILIWKSAWNSGTSNGQFNGTTYTHPGCDVGLGTGTTGVLGSGQCFVSPNGRFELLLQTDGNMVIYDRSVTPNAPIWSTGTGFSTADPSVAYRTLYFYDALGNLKCVEQHGDAASGTGCSAAPSSDATSPWRVRRFTYDSLSRLLTAKNPESGTISYAYDDDGNLLQKTSPAPNQTGTATQTLSYCYDELHRVTGKGYGAQSCPLATPVVTYAYDSGDNAKGHLTSLSDQAGTATYTYDIMGRLATETRPIAGISKSTSYTYNFDGSVNTLTYPSNRVVTYTPDSAGRLIFAVDGNGTQYVTSASYNPDGSLKSLVNGSTPALNQNFQYTPRLQLCRITILTSGTLPTTCTDSQHIGNIMDRGYDFHAGNGTPNSGADNGNVFAITNYRDTNRSQAFTYDALNRLTSGWSSANTGTYSWGENYSIDAWGNLQISPMSGKAHGGTFQLSGNAQNRPTGMAYDAAGNLLSYLAANYAYDQENRHLTTAGMTYTYDDNGERVLKSQVINNVLTPIKRYWSMGGNTLAEGDSSGNLTAEYVYFAGKRVARIDLQANTVHYYLSDHLGSTSIVASATGAVEEESDYYPFGTEVVVIGPGINELKFTGKRRDTESQLDYFGARYYSNMLGRWATPDWAAKPAAVPYAVLGDPQSLNLYTYVRNIPTTGIDPDGHCDSKFCQIAVGVFKGTGKFLWNNSPGGQAIDGIRQSIQDMKAGPAAAQARAQGQLKAAGTMVAAVTGNPVAQAQVVGAAVNSWNSMSTTDKTSTVTQGVLTIATIWIAGKIPAPGPSMVGFNEAETGMLNQSLKNLSGAGYDTRAFQQLVKSTDMPAATCAMCLSTPPTGAALGDGAFASQEMLDHTMEEELRHLGQDLSNQWIGRGDAAAKEAEVNANRKFPEPKQ